MSESPSRRAAGWSPPGRAGGGRGQRSDGYGRRANPAQTPWEPQPRSGSVRRARRPHSPRGYDEGYGQSPGQPGPGQPQGRSGGRGGAGYSGDYEDDAPPGPARLRRRARRSGHPTTPRRPARRRPRDDDYGYDEAPARGGTRRAPAARPAPAAPGGPAAARRRAPRRGGPALPLGPRLGIGVRHRRGPGPDHRLPCGAASSGGSSRSIAGITLNSQLLALSALAIPAMILIIGGLLRWRQLGPLGLTWGFSVVAGLSWLTLLFAVQMEKVIPHLTPLADGAVGDRRGGGRRGLSDRREHHATAGTRAWPR